MSRGSARAVPGGLSASMPRNVRAKVRSKGRSASSPTHQAPLLTQSSGGSQGGRNSPVAVSPSGRTALGPWEGPYSPFAGGNGPVPERSSSGTSSPIFLDSAGSCHFELDDGGVVPSRHKAIHTPPREVRNHPARDEERSLTHVGPLANPSAQYKQRRAHSLEMAALLGKQSHDRRAAQMQAGPKNVRQSRHLMQPRRGY